MRERRPGAFKIRVASGKDPSTGPTLQRSFYVYGDRADAGAARRELAELYATRRKCISVWPLLTVGDVLDRWLESDHDWRPSIWVSTRPTAKALRASLVPLQLRAIGFSSLTIR